MKEILLGKQATKHIGIKAIIDDEWFECISKYSWYAYLNPCTKSYYAARRGKKNTSEENMVIKMHNQIYDSIIPEKMMVDHINHNTLDNRKSNLRLATQQQNQMNQQPRKSCSSKYKGVRWRKESRKWNAQIRINGKKIHLGYFVDEQEAAKAYDNAAYNNFGEFAVLNFPKQSS